MRENYLQNKDKKLHAREGLQDGKNQRSQWKRQGHFRPLLQKFLERILIGNDCWEWIGTVLRGYGILTLRGRRFIASRYSYGIFRGSIPSRNLYVCHHCDNSRCVRPSHLFLGTSRDNLKDAVQKGRHTGTRTKLFGIENPAAKLTQEQVREIRIRYQPGVVTLKALSREYRVNFRTIHLIVKNRIWRDRDV